MGIKYTNKVMRKLLFLTLIICLSCNSKTTADKKNSLVLNSKGISLEYKDLQEGISDDLKISDITLLGEITTNSNVWFILSGVTSEPTYVDFGMYLYPKIKKEISDSIYKKKYSYPGREYSFDSLLIFESRVFYGKCTDYYKNSVIWYQREINDDLWDTSYFVVDFKTDNPIFSHINKNNINIDDILQNIRDNKCKEIPGKEKYDEP